MKIAEAKVMEYLAPRVREVFRSAARAIFDRINNDDFLFESQTHNLRASIGIAVFQDGIMTDWIENPYIVPELKTWKYKGQIYQFSGLAERDAMLRLEAALGAHELKAVARWVMLLVAAAPYAYFVEVGEGNQPAIGQKRGVGWWSEDIVPLITEEFKRNARLLAI